MAGNSFGTVFRLTTFGESHGELIGGVIDGCPPGMPLGVDDIQPDLDRRKPGQSRHTTQRRETDTVRIVSGIFEGVTTGTPIALLIANEDARSRDYDKIREQFRPGHADYTYFHKYGIRDYRGGGRASARETAVRVAAGAVAKKYLLLQHDIRIRAYVAAVGDQRVAKVDWDCIETNPFFCPDAALAARLPEYMDALRKSGESVGARVNVVADNVPLGLGEPVFDRFDADLAKALMSINASKGVEVGDGFAVVEQRGSDHRDPITPEGFRSNHAGGVLGGITNGAPVTASVAFKPTASLRLPVASVDVNGNAVEVVTHGRHDPCVGIRAVPIVEAMTALVIIDHLLRHRAQCGNLPIR